MTTYIQIPQFDSDISSSIIHLQSIHACIHTYIRTGTPLRHKRSQCHHPHVQNMHTYIHTYIHTYRYANSTQKYPMSSSTCAKYACMHTYIHTYIQVRQFDSNVSNAIIHLCKNNGYIHTCIHTYIHTGTPIRLKRIQFHHTPMQNNGRTNIQARLGIPSLKHSLHSSKQPHRTHVL